MNLEQYIDNINKRYKLGNATEHTFRGDLQQLIESLVPTIRATNEPKRQSCGAPDYILTKKDIPVGFIEAKDIGDKDLEGAKKTGNKEQFDRYKASLNNLIFTDYLDFHLYREGEFVTKIAIGEVTEKGIKPIPENFDRFENLIKDFCTHIGQTIKSSKKLAEMMAGKARLLSEVIEKALTSDENNSEDSTLKDQMIAFKQILIHDITPKGFADVYAQTIAYGMFAARSHDPTLETFSRVEAYELIPKSNPFLKKLFGYIAGLDVDDRIKWIVDDLVNIFLACNVEEMLKNYGKSTKTEDPIIHFYEDFLSEYDPKLRKARGVWYTPAPVVNFIVRAVDDILKSEFDLPQGLADTSKITTPSVGHPSIGRTTPSVGHPSIGRTTPSVGHPSGGGELVHRVQILDPATGTGTFLAEVIKLIHKKFEGQQGIWSNYVETHLLPRLNGFELLMASYAMAHLKLDLLLTETGYKPTKDQRYRVYLTNSLEEYHPDTGTLFANWLSTEANEANHIKRDTPVMCIIGNPPYSGESANKGEWIMSLMEDYKKEPGGKEKLNERNPKWINDDYVKFLRYGQFYIEKNGSGVLAFINPHGFLDNPTFRGMRWNLLKTYDKIYTIDLHGNSKKKEVSPDGSPDVNVFDIMQGVSINIFIKTGKKKLNELGKIFHYDLYGKREVKYDFLNENSIKTVAYKELPNIAPNYFFVSKDFEQQKNYDIGFKITNLFTLFNVGIVTARDEFTIHNSKQDIENTIIEFLTLDDENARNKFKLGKDVRDWQVNFAKKDLQSSFPYKGHFEKISYRPFDDRWTFYTGKSKGFHCYPRNEIMQHFIKGENLGLVTVNRQPFVNATSYYFLTKNIFSTGFIRSDSVSIDNVFPLYLYPETNEQQTIGQTTERTPNLNTEIVNQIASQLGLSFVREKNSPPPEGCPQDGVVYLPTQPQDGLVHSPTQPQEEVVHSPTQPQDGVVHLPTQPQDGVVHSPTHQQDSPSLSPQKHTVHSNEKSIIAYINSIPIKRNFIEDLPYNPSLSKLAKDKRKAGILSEVLFWQQVHQGKFYAIDFDRQRIIGNYIVDFYVKTLGLVVEIDGSSHDNKAAYDAERQKYLESLGLKIFRVTDADVKKSINEVMRGLEEFVCEEFGVTPPVGHPSVGGERTTPSYGHPSNGGEFGEFAPIDILDYIYAVLHSPSYREKYKEFLKIDFPRVPYPKDKDTFWQLVKLGGEIRQIHLLESPTVEKFITQYPIDGDNIVSKPQFLTDGLTHQGISIPQAGVVGKVYINDTQFFDNVPEIAWNFYIGGYQPAQKWLKDRKNRKLEFEDILHYQKIIVALSETDRLMAAIDNVEIE